MKNEIINMLVAFGSCENRAQAQNYIKNKSDAELKQLYLILLRHRVYAFYND